MPPCFMLNVSNLDHWEKSSYSSLSNRLHHVNEPSSFSQRMKETATQPSPSDPRNTKKDLNEFFYKPVKRPRKRGPSSLKGFGSWNRITNHSTVFGTDLQTFGRQTLNRSHDIGTPSFGREHSTFPHLRRFGPLNPDFYIFCFILQP